MFLKIVYLAILWKLLKSVNSDFFLLHFAATYLRSQIKSDCKTSNQRGVLQTLSLSHATRMSQFKAIPRN